jgi:hypothetical protein
MKNKLEPLERACELIEALIDALPNTDRNDDLADEAQEFLRQIEEKDYWVS